MKSFFFELFAGQPFSNSGGVVRFAAAASDYEAGEKQLLAASALDDHAPWTPAANLAELHISFIRG